MSHAKKRMERLQRVKILLLESGGMTYHELEETLNVHRATIFRDLEELGAISDKGDIWRYIPTDEDLRLAVLLNNHRLNKS